MAQCRPSGCERAADVCPCGRKWWYTAAWGTISFSGALMSSPFLRGCRRGRATSVSHDFRIGIYILLVYFLTLQVRSQMAFDVANATSHLHVVTACTFFSGFSIFFFFFFLFSLALAQPQPETLTNFPHLPRGLDGGGGTSSNT